MKTKAFIVILAVLLSLSLCACGLTTGANQTTSVTSDSAGSGNTDASGNEDSVYPTEISLPATATLVVGDTLTLSLSYEPTDTTVKTGIVWSSSDAQVATVDSSSGLITAVGSGTATITVSVSGETETLQDTCELTVKESSSDESIEVVDQTGDFTLTPDENGSYTQEGNIYTVTAAGEYVLSGSLNGQIVVDAGEDAEVTIVLSGVTIKYDRNSPIYVKSADSVTIKAQKGTQNSVYDMRSTKTEDVDDQGEGAISAKCDLKFAATGTLYVEGNYNNGIHTTKDLKIQKMTLKVKAYNNAIKGKDSVTIESGEIVAISTNGDGIETSNTDVSSKGKQRGTITVNGGTIEVYAAGDGVQSAYNFEMNDGTLSIKNGSYSAYTSKSSTVDSYKGIKVKNELIVNGGQITIQSYDDGLHADYGTELENGETGLGIITINDGSVTIAVTASSSRYVSGADAIHADNTLNIAGGVVSVSSAYEGLEANFINISGGTVTVSATDDGLNAANKINKTPAITISGGTVDITMASGDTDGIDSNGTFKMTGGVVISRGAPNSNSGMATGLDCDGTATITGGTFIQLGARETVLSTSGCATLNYGSSQGGMGGGMGGMGGMGGRPMSYDGSSAGATNLGGTLRGGYGGQTSSYTFTSGTWTVTGTDISFTVGRNYTYYGCVVYSSALTAGTSYTVTNGTTSYTASAS